MFSFQVTLNQISSAFAIIFAGCHSLSCLHVRASSYIALFRVSLRGIGLRCVGLAQKISARCNTGSYVFFFLLICIFILFLALSHMYVFFYSLSTFPQIWKKPIKANIDQNWNPFYPHYLFQRTPVIYNFTSQENVFLWRTRYALHCNWRGGEPATDHLLQMPSHKHDHTGCLLMIFMDDLEWSWIIATSGEAALGNSPNKETRKGIKAVFDSAVPYYIPSEITSHFCNLIGSQQCDSLEVELDVEEKQNILVHSYHK